MRFAKISPLYSVRCSAYSNSHQGCWASLKFVNNKNFNDAVMIFFFGLFLTPIFYFQIYLQPLKSNCST